MMEEGDYNLVWLKASDGTWVQVKKGEQRFGCGVWILGDIFGLFFQKWLVVVAVVTKNLGRDLVSLWKFCWGAFVAFRWLIKTLGSQTFLENLHEQFLQQGQAVGKILVGYLMLCLVATVCLFISPVTLTMLLTATLNVWCAELKGVLAKTGEQLLFHFSHSSCVSVPLKTVYALIKGHLETLRYFSSLCFGSSCAKMCI